MHLVVDYTPRFSDFVAARRAWNAPTWLWRFWLILGIFQTLLGMVQIIVLHTWLAGALSLLAGVLFIFLRRLVVLTDAWGAMRRPGASGRQQMTIDDDGLHVSNGIGVQDNPWDWFRYVQENSRSIVLVMTSQDYFFIPKRLLSADELTALRDHLQARVPIYQQVAA